MFSQQPQLGQANQGWFASIYPLLAPKTRQQLATAGLILTMLTTPAGAASQRPNPAGQQNLIIHQAIQQLGLNTPEIIGDDFQVNTYTTNQQNLPAVASDSNGNFVIVWESSNDASGGDTSGFSIQGQRYNSVGTPQGQFLVNTYITSNQQNPAVAMDSDGDFVVVWQSFGSPDNDNSYNSIQGQRFNSNGVAQGSQFQVNSFTNDTQSNPSVALDSDGDFVVVWQSNGSGSDSSYYSVQGQRFNSVGTAQGLQFEINTLTTNNQQNPALAIDSSGNFVVVWQSKVSAGSDNSSDSIQRRRYNSSGTALDVVAEIQVNTYTNQRQTRPAVAMDSNGDFVVAWESYQGNGTDPYYSVQGQRFNSNGTAQGSQFQINTYTTGSQYRPAVTMDSDGDFVIIWHSSGSSGPDNSGDSIQGRVFSDSGLPLVSEFQVNHYTSNAQNNPAVAVDSDGDFVVAWQSMGSAGGDISNTSIQAQQLDFGQLDHQANTYTTNNQAYPAVASDSNGDFVVVWQSIGSFGNDTGGRSIQARLYDSNGLPKGNQFQVNSYTTLNQSYPAVSMDSDGDFVVVWASASSPGPDNSGYSIQGQRFNSNGLAQGSQFQINTYTTNDQRFCDIALDSDGDFVVVWESGVSLDSDNSGYSIQGQRYNSVGTPQSGQFQVNNYTTNSQLTADVSLDSDGDFVVVWQSDGSSSSDTAGFSVQGQRYNSVGTPQSGQFQVNSYTTSDQFAPAVSLDSDGDFVVVWQSSWASGDASNDSIQGQRYNSVGTLQGSQFQVNTYTTNSQNFPALSRDSDGDFVVTWGSIGSFGGDTSLGSVQGQRYNSAAVAQGVQFQVNTYTINNQSRPAVALDAGGDFVVAWQSTELNFPPFGPDSDLDEGIAVSRFTVTGGPLPTVVGLTTTSMAPAGNILAQTLTALAGLVTGLWLWLRRKRPI